MTVPMIIDTDPGIDDAMAIYYAAADPDIEIMGLTTVFGNVHVEQATRNALYLLEQSGMVAPVFKGAAKPLELPLSPPSSQVHGDEGFGGLPAPQPIGKAEEISAAEFLVKCCAANPGEVVICAIGPLTNLALALRLDPHIAHTVKRVVIMGGSVEAGGNITKHAEANIYHDPHAAAEVFAAEWEVVMVGLDVTHDIICTDRDFDRVKAKAPKLGGFIKAISEFYLDFYASVGLAEGCHLHDPAAIIAAAHPQYFNMVPASIRVVLDGEEQGRTVADANAGTPPVQVCMEVDADGVKARFINFFGQLS